MTSSRDFYQNLTPLTDFASLHQERYYHKLPSDWYVVVTDIKGSTEAIEKGRYRDVNTLGAAAIAAVQAAVPGAETLSVFGGDGASFLVPAADLPSVKEALLGLKALSTAVHGLTLRVGGIDVTTIRQAGLEVEVAKFDLGAGKTIPLLRGGGMSYADTQIKAPNSSYEWREHSSYDPKLGSLSCRWQPLPSERGIMLTLIVKERGNGYLIYEEVLGELVQIFGENWNDSSPIKPSSMRYKSLWSIVKDEWRLQRLWPVASFLKRMLEIFVSILAFRWRVPMPFETQTYLHETRQHSDYRKFDDMLRLVLDCTEEELGKIQALLRSLHDRGKIYYGTHTSDHALMTCLVENMQSGGHLHFIDGSDGGYTLAALMLKKQAAG